MPKQQLNLGRQRQAALSRKQERFIAEYRAGNGNGTAAARRAGYKGNSNVLGVQAHDNLRLPKIKAEIARLDERDGLKVTPFRVQRRLDEISHAAQGSGQFGPAVRAEELLGKSIGMWVDQSIQLSGVLNDAHVTALIELAKRRQAQPIDLKDDDVSHTSSHIDDDEG